MNTINSILPESISVNEKRQKGEEARGSANGRPSPHPDPRESSFPFSEEHSVARCAAMALDILADLERVAEFLRYLELHRADETEVPGPEHVDASVRFRPAGPGWLKLGYWHTWWWVHRSGGFCRRGFIVTDAQLRAAVLGQLGTVEIVWPGEAEAVHQALAARAGALAQ